MQRLPHNRSAVMMLEPPRVDGRRLRSERTRLAIIEAYLDLLRGGPRMPTAARIARQAGRSVRSIFERFSDLNALSLATADYAIAQGQAEAVARSVDGDRPTRIQSHVETRARACVKWRRSGALSRTWMSWSNSGRALLWCASLVPRE